MRVKQYLRNAGLNYGSMEVIYLDSAIRMVDSADFRMGDINAAVAEKFNKTPSQVDRCMRYALGGIGKKPKEFIREAVMEVKECDY